MSLIFGVALLAAQTGASSGFVYGFPDGDTSTNPAIDDRLSTAFRTCVRNPQLDPPAKNNCIFKEHSRQDIILNITYRRTMLRLTAKRRFALRAAERAWITGVTVYCRQRDSEITDGTDTPCAITETVRRTRWLEQLR